MNNMILSLANGYDAKTTVHKNRQHAGALCSMHGYMHHMLLLGQRKNCLALHYRRYQPLKHTCLVLEHMACWDC